MIANFVIRAAAASVRELNSRGANDKDKVRPMENSRCLRLYVYGNRSSSLPTLIEFLVNLLQDDLDPRKLCPRRSLSLSLSLSLFTFFSISAPASVCASKQSGPCTVEEERRGFSQPQPTFSGGERIFPFPHTSTNKRS